MPTGRESEGRNSEGVVPSILFGHVFNEQHVGLFVYHNVNPVTVLYFLAISHPDAFHIFQGDFDFKLNNVTLADLLVTKSLENSNRPGCERWGEKNVMVLSLTLLMHTAVSGMGALTFHLQSTGCLLPIHNKAVLSLVLLGDILDCEVLAPSAGCN